MSNAEYNHKIIGVFWSYSSDRLIILINDTLTFAQVQDNTVIIVKLVSVRDVDTVSDVRVHLTMETQKASMTKPISIYQLNYKNTSITMYSNDTGDYFVPTSTMLPIERFQPRVYPEYSLFLSRQSEFTLVAHKDTSSQRSNKFVFYKLHFGKSDSKFETNLCKKDESPPEERYFFELSDKANIAFIRYYKDFIVNAPKELEMFGKQPTGLIEMETIVMFDQENKCVYVFNYNNLYQNMSNKKSFLTEYKSFEFKDYFKCLGRRKRQDTETNDKEDDKQTEEQQKENADIQHRCYRSVSTEMFTSYNKDNRSMGVSIIVVLLLIAFAVLVCYFYFSKGKASNIKVRTSTENDSSSTYKVSGKLIKKTMHFQETKTTIEDTGTNTLKSDLKDRETKSSAPEGASTYKARTIMLTPDGSTVYKHTTKISPKGSKTLMHSIDTEYTPKCSK